MISEMVILAQRGANSPANQWLRENPMVLGLIFLVIGSLLLFFGIREIRSGVAHDKYGNVIPGGMGQVTALVRVVGGVGCCAFAIYKMVMG